MTITARNEVIINATDAPLMELLEHAAKYYAPYLEYCLDELGWHDDRGMETQPRLLTEPAQVEQLDPGTIIKDADGKLRYKRDRWWANLESIARGVIDEILVTSIRLPATVVFTPEVQA